PKMDEHLTSGGGVVQRVAAPRVAKSASDEAAKLGKPPMQRPANGLPEDFREHVRLMCDIIALGFQTDRTRVATLLMARDISGLTYPFLGVRRAHHPASHEDLSAEYE